MKKITRNYSHLIVCVLFTALLTACGNNQQLPSSTIPAVFYSHSVAIHNGLSYAWGANTFGQLGNNDTSGVSQLSPQLVVGLAATGMDGISAGGTHTVAFKNNTSAYAWGNNGYGQLGNTSATSSALPLQVYRYELDEITIAGPLTRVIAVSAGGNHNLAIDSGNNVWAWGDNYYGQLGDGTLSVRYAAVSVLTSVNGSPLTGVSKISAGGSHSLALMGNNTVINGNLVSSGNVMSWGYNAVGQLGNKVTVFGIYSTGLNSTLPTPVVLDAPNNPNLSNVTSIAAGGSHSLFLVNGGLSSATVWSCGYNFAGQLGDGTTINRNHGVVQVIFPSNVITSSRFPVQVAAGLDHSLVRMSDGTVWGWGFNFYGELGNLAALGLYTPQPTAVQVMVSASAPLSGVTKIVAVGNSSFAVDNNGQLWAWGENSFGQLGLGGTNPTNQNFANPVPGFSTGTVLYSP